MSFFITNRIILIKQTTNCKMESTVTFIPNHTYEEFMQRDDLYEDCTKQIDLKALKKQLNIKTSVKSMKVLVLTKRHPDFKNVANKDVAYKTFCLASAGDDGTRYEIYGGNRLLGRHHPLGNAFVVV